MEKKQYDQSCQMWFLKELLGMTKLKDGLCPGAGKISTMERDELKLLLNRVKWISTHYDKTEEISIGFSIE